MIDDAEDSERGGSEDPESLFTWHRLLSQKTAVYLYDGIVHVRALFGAFDGLIISYSTFKMFFDISCPPNQSAADMMHEWLESPEIAAVAALEALVIITLSYIGNVCDEDHKNKYLAFIAWLWAYVRDVIKGLKFAYRGVRSTLQMLEIFGVDVSSALLPAGLGLGVLAAANRVWYRNQVTERRKKYQKQNVTLLKMAQNLGAENYYELCNMPTDKASLKFGKIYIHVNDKEGLLTYKVYDPLVS